MYDSLTMIGYCRVVVSWDAARDAGGAGVCSVTLHGVYIPACLPMNFVPMQAHPGDSSRTQHNIASAYDCVAEQFHF